MSRVSLRWVAIFIFVLSSTLNYLDRQVLAALAPVLKDEFHLTNQDYGLIISVFSLVYAGSAPLMGLFVDRVGLNRGISISVAAWSLASVATGFVGSFRGLLFCRGALGVAEAAGIPSAGKANGTYLEPREFALGTATNQVGLSLGGIAAPLIVAALVASYGWRSPFIVCGLVGFLWIPLWLWIGARAPKRPAAGRHEAMPVLKMARDRGLWGLMIANVFAMVLYTLWTNWTTLYFVQAHGLTQEQANQHFAWIPPVAATLGGFAGGWMAFRWIRAGLDVLRARIRVCLISALMALLTAVIPLMPSAGWAAAAISMSYFWVTAMSTNVYVMPIDLFGQARAAFGVSAITLAYGLMQAFFSPVIGGMIDRFGFSAVCVSFAFLPLVAVGVLRVTLR